MQRVLFVPFLEKKKPLEKQRKITERYHRRNAEGYAVEGVKRKDQTTGVNWVCKACERASS